MKTARELLEEAHKYDQKHLQGKLEPWEVMMEEEHQKFVN